MSLRCHIAQGCAVLALAGCAGPPPPRTAAVPAAPPRAAVTVKDVGKRPKAPAASAPGKTPPAVSRPRPPAPAARPDPAPPPKAPAQPPAVDVPPVARPAAPGRRHREPDAIQAEVDRLMAALASTPAAAEAAFRELWEVESELIPALLLEVDRNEPSQLRELKILIPDRDEFARRNVGLNATGDAFSYDVPGMGRVQYDDLSTGPARERGLKVVLRRFSTPASKPFSVGEALRAGLLNRLQCRDYPPGNNAGSMVAWWQRYYELARSNQ